MPDLLNKIYFRCDGNKVLGYGHLARCGALYSILEPSFTCCFLTKNTAYDEFVSILGNGFCIKVIRSEKEILDLITCKDAVVFDTYDLNHSVLQEIKAKSARIVYIDDFVNNLKDADLIINHAPGVKEVDYENLKGRLVATGLDYSLLREDFIKSKPDKRIIKEIKRVFFSIGGSEQNQLATTILERLLLSPKIHCIHVLTGNSAKIIKLDDSRVRFHKGLKAREVAKLMLESDLAIVPSSTISLEALMCKCIIITGTTANNQNLIYKGLRQYNNVIGIGEMRKYNWNELNTLISEIVLPLRVNYKFNVHENLVNLFKRIFK